LDKTKEPYSQLVNQMIRATGLWTCPYLVERLSLYDGHFGFE
jgi:hypothetical protein